MQVYCKGTARIQHHATGEIHEIESEALDWDAVGGDERQMGSEIHYEATIEHAELGEISWGLWEYPIGIENHRVTNAGRNKVIEDFDYGLEHGKPEPDEWVDYSVPDDPFTIFMSSYHHTGDLLADHGSHSGRHLVNRMIFSHQITAMEAYLADRLINEIAADAGAFQRLLSKDEDLAKEKFTLAEISKDLALVERNVREHLRSIQYHNLAKVDVLYNIALGIRILSLANDRARLFKAVMLRHDCVHRNGFDKDGNELVVFTKTFVQDTADLIKGFVEGIERAVRARSTTTL
ncbi:conserved hypothetical protein [Bosea sp. 62]|uniref:hypothetical protein n=1 Tax=unclassified Bosea (in: a-proteobacteria) TaxID=2653178 RepID=UPI0012597E37|nr:MULTISPECIES: hypothetical protein [unclassified Bosea (in: a-proteobacteria)]CAD5291774.1 conserved hypothetical protein [Bosea sp. 21B]CAD5292858.1 conserved hypothetical protein [Bosea sp. 46]CAD5299979.1 conserved hypothetical protein [Bosea sp. 7B]VVT57111.1 conserved hypothetical protein [Bosea sp. EC-HK365B]VXB49052.1 conserved hypothetical protein [Bosea sp. 127]